MNVTLKADRNFAACCDNESSRYALGSVSLTATPKGQVLATATDGRCLTIAEVEGSIDAPVLMPMATVPKTKAGGDIIGNGEWITTSGKKRDKVTKTDPLEAGGRFPACEDVFPQYAEDASDCTHITIDVALLAKMATAISGGDEARGITLLIKTKDDAIGVVGKRGIGVLMPLASGRDDVHPAADLENRLNDYKASL